MLVLLFLIEFDIIDRYAELLLRWIQALISLYPSSCLLKPAVRNKTQAHAVCNQSTKCFHAAASLSGKIQWCLTGATTQNNLEDLEAFVRFLQVLFLETPHLGIILCSPSKLAAV